MKTKLLRFVTIVSVGLAALSLPSQVNAKPFYCFVCDEHWTPPCWSCMCDGGKCECYPSNLRSSKPGVSPSTAEAFNAAKALPATRKGGGKTEASTDDAAKAAEVARRASGQQQVK